MREYDKREYIKTEKVLQLSINREITYITVIAQSHYAEGNKRKRATIQVSVVKGIGWIPRVECSKT